MIEILCNGEVHYIRPTINDPDVVETLALIERHNRLFGYSSYHVRNTGEEGEGMTHTPGPWRWSPKGTLSTTAKVSKTCDNVVVWSQKYGFDNEADKTLIAAAPELLAACQAFVEAWEESLQLEKTDVALRMAKQAIEKARREKVQ